MKGMFSAFRNVTAHVERVRPVVNRGVRQPDLYAGTAAGSCCGKKTASRCISPPSFDFVPMRAVVTRRVTTMGTGIAFRDALFPSLDELVALRQGKSAR